MCGSREDERKLLKGVHQERSGGRAVVARRGRAGTHGPRPEGVEALAGLEISLYFFPSPCRAVSRSLR